MEALQTGPDSSGLHPRTTIRSSYESVKNRLKWLPGVPSTLSSVFLPPQSPEPKYVTGNSSDITIITPPPTQSASETSTAATSVLSLPRVFTIQKLYVSPSMPINEKIQAVWTQQIRSRLGAVLFHSIHSGTCVQEFMMVGKGPNTLKPTILITCGDAATKDKVEKTIKSQAWLHELLKANHMGLVALVAKTPLSSGLASSNGSIVKLSESYAVQLLPSEAATSCGLGLLIGGVDNRLRQHCTLGGLLLINGEVLGLTAGHPFREIERNSMRSELLEASQVGEDLSDEESGTISSEPFIFNDDDGDVIDNLSASTMSLHENSGVHSSSIDEPPHTQQEASRPFLSSMKWYMPQAAVLPASTSIPVSSVEDPLYNHDWALLETLPPSVTSRPNKVAHNDLGHDILIDRTVSGPACGEVTISIAGIGPQAGYLHFSPATMKIDKSVLDVQLITLEQVLRKFYFSLRYNESVHVLMPLSFDSSRKFWCLGDSWRQIMRIHHRNSAGYPVGLHGGY